MKMFLRRAALAALLATSFTSCIYQNIVIPLDTDLDVTELGTKTGESTMRTYFWVVQVGDAGVQAAARNGQISVLRHADQKRFNVLSVYQECSTIVYGD